MRSSAGSRQGSAPEPLRAWLRHGGAIAVPDSPLGAVDSPVNHLSQENVLQQLDHLRSYPLVRDRIATEEVANLHAWWFELSTANVFAY